MRGLNVLQEAEEHHKAHRTELKDLKEKIQELDAQLGTPHSPGAGVLSLLREGIILISRRTGALISLLTLHSNETWGPGTCLAEGSLLYRRQEGEEARRQEQG